MKIYATTSYIIRKALTFLALGSYLIYLGKAGLGSTKEMMALAMIILSLFMAGLALVRFWMPVLLIEKKYVLSLGLIRQMEVESFKEVSVFRKEFLELIGPKGKVRLEKRMFHPEDLTHIQKSLKIHTVFMD